MPRLASSIHLGLKIIVHQNNKKMFDLNILVQHIQPQSQLYSRNCFV